MKYLKLEHFIIFFIIIYLTIQFEFLPKAKIKLHKEQFISETILNIPIEILSYKDGIYKISSYKKEKNKNEFYFETFTILLKKGQKYIFEYKIDTNFFENNNIHLVVKEITTNRKIFYKKFIIKKPTKEIKTSFQSSPVIAKQTTSTIETKEEKLKIEKYSPSSVPKEEIPDFEILISSDMIKKEYHYNSVLNIFFKIKNRSNYSTLTIDTELNLKNESDIIISSKTLNLKIPAQKTKEVNLDLEIKPSILPGKYFVELIFSTSNKKIKTETDRFLVIDTPPKITLQEKPIIKYKFSNTILVEVEDDRGVSEVKLVELDIKKKTQKENPMMLIAGNKLLGLYSFSTQKINQKDFYNFYIQATDIAGNTSTTEIFKIKITK